MNILYIGDVMGKAGRRTVARVLPKLRQDYEVDFVIAQSENVSHGKSMSPLHMDELISYGVDFFSGGNHSHKREQLHERLINPEMPVIGVANVVDEYPGVGYKIVETKKGNILVCSLLGDVFPEDLKISSPLKKIDGILDKFKDYDLGAIVVNIHTDYSSHKIMTGHYLDGRVSLVVGDHWHVPTADARVLPGGTGYITDVGMVGVQNSSLGIDFDQTIPRWRDEIKTKQVMAEKGPYQFCSALAEVSSKKQSIKITQIIKVIDKL